MNNAQALAGLTLLLATGAGVASAAPARGGSVIDAWAGDAPVVVWVEVVDLMSYGAPEADPRSEVSLVVSGVLRDRTGSLAEGDVFDLDVPGGRFGDVSVMTSEAPFFTLDAQGLLLLTLGQDGVLTPARGIKSMLGTDGAHLAACVSPDAEEVPLCFDEGLPIVNPVGLDRAGRRLIYEVDLPRLMAEGISE